MKFNEDYLKRFEDAFGNADAKLNGMKLKKWFNSNKDIEDYLNSLLQSDRRFHNFQDTLWAFRNKFDIDDYRCKTCGKLMTLERPSFYLKEHCSNRCAKLDPDTTAKLRKTISEDIDYYKKRQAKIKKTCIERYGSEAPSQNEEVKKKMKEHWENDPDFWKRRNEKSRITWLKNLGVENPSSSEKVKQKKADTCLKNFGVDIPAKSKAVQDKIKKTNLEKYGVECQFQRKNLIDKANDMSWKRINSWSQFVVPVFTREDWKGFDRDILYKWKCQKCNKIFEQKLYTSKYAEIDDNVPRCLDCFPKSRNESVEELEVLDFIRNFYPSAKKDKELIKPKELDIAIPELKLAVEFNGDYWHSVKANDPFCHLKKLQLCEFKDWKLVNLFEFYWKQDKELVKRKLKELILPELNEEEIAIKEIEEQEAYRFYEENSLDKEVDLKETINVGAISVERNEIIEIASFKLDKENKSAILVKHEHRRKVLNAFKNIVQYFIALEKSLEFIVAEEDRLWPIDKDLIETGFEQISSNLPRLRKNGAYDCGASVLRLSVPDK